MLNKLFLLLINVYQKTLSPDKGRLSPWLKGRVCAHEPHCSEYAKECFQKYRFGQALYMTSERVISCTPSNEKKYDPSSYRVVFASWAPIWVPFLEAIHQDPRYDLVWVMTMPDAARDRWQKTKENIIKKTATGLWIAPDDIITPASLRRKSKKHAADAAAAYERLDDKQADLLIVVAYGHILPKDILDLPKSGCINVHGSLLPKYRGASPLQSIFLEGEEESGVTIMLMDEWMDTGDMLSKLKTKLPLERTVVDLIEWIKKQWPKHLLDTMRDHLKWDIEPKSQDDSLASYCSKFDKQDWLIDPFTDSLESIYHKYQGFALWPKIYFEYKPDKRAIIEQIQLDIDKFETSKQDVMIWLYWDPAKDLQYLHPAVSKLTIKPEGKKAITRDEFQANYLTK